MLAPLFTTPSTEYPTGYITLHITQLVTVGSCFVGCVVKRGNNLDIADYSATFKVQREKEKTCRLSLGGSTFCTLTQFRQTKPTLLDNLAIIY